MGTGKLFYYKELEWLGFYLDNVNGRFGQNQVDLLLDFCEKNPEYHIMTQTHPGRYVNRYIPGNDSYFLANGDKNPTLMLNPFIRENADLFAEDMLNTALAVIADINGSNNCE